MHFSFTCFLPYFLNRLHVIWHTFQVRRFRHSGVLQSLSNLSNVDTNDNRFRHLNVFVKNNLLMWYRLNCQWFCLTHMQLVQFVTLFQQHVLKGFVNRSLVVGHEIRPERSSLDMCASRFYDMLWCQVILRFLQPIMSLRAAGFQRLIWIKKCATKLGNLLSRPHRASYPGAFS